MFEENSNFYKPPFPESFDIPEIPKKVKSFNDLIEEKEENFDTKIDKQTLCYELKGLVNESFNFFKSVVKNNSEYTECVEYLKGLHKKINKKVKVLEEIYVKNKIEKMKN